MAHKKRQIWRNIKIKEYSIEIKMKFGAETKLWEIFADNELETI
jgi:hypothetical protein